jgi:hypothetical protein
MYHLVLLLLMLIGEVLGDANQSRSKRARAAACSKQKGTGGPRQKPGCKGKRTGVSAKATWEDLPFRTFVNMLRDFKSTTWSIVS